MHIQDKILLVVGSEEGSGKSFRGRTILQKKLYFLSVLNRQHDLGFRPHYYGPYSRLVAENLDILVYARFLKEVTETFPTDRNIFGEIRRHTYSLDRSDVKDVMDEIEKEIEDDEYEDWKRALETLTWTTIGDAILIRSQSLRKSITLSTGKKAPQPNRFSKKLQKSMVWNIDDKQAD